jgi:8-oxo-dGTP diphosphatase
MSENSDQQADLMVDVVILTLNESARLCVLLTKRKEAPFEGSPALPGRYIRIDEDVDADEAAQKVLLSKTGLKQPYLEQLYTFTGRFRDARNWSASIAYFALVPMFSLSAQSDTARGYSLVPVDTVPKLPFDHNEIIAKAVDRVRGKAAYTSLPCHLLPETFTLADLQSTYEAVLGHALDKSSFRRKVDDLDFLEKVTEMRVGKHRPAQLYRIKPSRSLAFFDRTV